MPYTFTFEPLNRIQGVSPTTATAHTAVDCLRQVRGLEMSDERVTDIVSPDGRSISKAELELLAASEDS